MNKRIQFATILAAMSLATGMPFGHLPGNLDRVRSREPKPIDQDAQAKMDRAEAKRTRKAQIKRNGGKR